MRPADAGGAPHNAAQVEAAPVHELQRLTTRYSAEHDRIRLAGELPDGGQVALWITQRMFLRLLPVLLDWLERHGSVAPAARSAQALYAEALQGFAQQAALAQLTQLPPQAPVDIRADSPEHLVRSVQIDRSPDGLRLVFVNAEGPVVAMQLQALPLRQWLSIVYGVWTGADWPQHLWPDWLIVSETERAVQPGAQVH